MRKNLFKALIFILIFSALFWLAQELLRYPWKADEDTYIKMVSYSEEPAGTIDVLYFGTSEMYYDVVPVIGYEKTGITGMNLACTRKSAMTAYYQLKEALEYQIPKLVVCDFSALYEDETPAEYEQIYRKITDSLIKRKFRYELIGAIKKAWPEESVLNYVFPLLRYHSRWSTMTWADLKRQGEIVPYEQYQWGANFSIQKNEEIYEIDPGWWSVDEEKVRDIAPVQAEYYDKFISLCQENGIEVAALMLPRFYEYDTSKKVTNWEKTKAFLEERNVKIIDEYQYEEIERMQLDQYQDYYDRGHANVSGAMKIMGDLSEKLQEAYKLPDHRGDAAYAAWDQNVIQFHEKYDDFLAVK